jgi:hypothetical protein
VTNTNTAACETLPSALDNFISHFFGTVIKTEVNGQVTWSLPCSLDVGLANNPRGADEGLACYFLRLFEEGIVGATGPKGDTGSAGADGRHAFTVTLESFTHPAVGGSITVKVYATPVIAVGQIVFVTSSGWYDVIGVSGDGTLVLTLLEAVSGASGSITAGKTVAVTGPRGITGAGGSTGAQGIQGIQGPAGDEFTPTNGFVGCAGASHSIQFAISQVAFGGIEPQVTLPAIGTYMIDVQVGITMDPTAAAAPGEIIVLRLWNATAGIYENSLDVTDRCFDPSQHGHLYLMGTITTTVANETLQLYASISVADKAVIVPAQTRLRYVRLA